MARHTKAYTGEKLTAHLHMQLTPSDRAAIDAAAAEQGLLASEFGRSLLLNGLANHNISQGKRAAQREEMAKVLERLIAGGLVLNDLAKKANEAKRIKEQKATREAAARASETLLSVPALGVSRTKNPMQKKLTAELAAIGNNAGQLRRLAEKQQLYEVNAELLTLEARLVETLDRVLPA